MNKNNDNNKSYLLKTYPVVTIIFNPQNKCLLQVLFFLSPLQVKELNPKKLSN